MFLCMHDDVIPWVLKHNTIDQAKQSTTKIQAYEKVANHKPVKGILL